MTADNGSRCWDTTLAVARMSGAEASLTPEFVRSHINEAVLVNKSRLQSAQ